MNAKELKKAIIQVLSAGLVPYIEGSPGVGKSDIIRAVAKEYKLSVIDLRLSQCDPTDLMGFVTHNGERMGYAPPEHFPLQEFDKPPEGYEGWLLFLDEMPSAPLSVQAAAFKLVLDKMVGKYHLHKNVAIVCAGNKSSDNSIVNRISTAMQSRLIHLELDVDAKTWIEWAAENNIDHRVISYIEGRPDHLHNFDPNHDDKTFSCPRTWFFTSKLIKDKEVTPLTLELLIGTLSGGIAHEFNAYLQYCNDLPSFKDISANPETVSIPNEPAMLYATSHMVAAYIDSKNAEVLMKYIARLPLEFATTAIRSALKRNKELLKVEAVREWSHQVAEEIF